MQAGSLDLDSSAPLFVVGIGASAGGLEALEMFFDHTPPHSGLAFIVVQHLSPHYKSLMVELLSKHTAMTVKQAEDGESLRPDVVYAMPPGRHVTLHEGTLRLTDARRASGKTFPIDMLFESIARDRGAQGVGIVLSGTGTDGTHGGRMIKEAGGLFIAQSPETAQFDGMPRSAIRAGRVDQVLPPDKMPPMLIRFVRFPRQQDLYRRTLSADAQTGGLDLIYSTLSKHHGIDFSDYKPPTIVRRIEHRMGILSIADLDEYARYVQASRQESEILYRELLIGVTRFFRDPEAFDRLRDHVIPELFKRARKRSTSSLRVWVAGCSTGEEAYSIAILLREEARKQQGQYFDVKVFATDVDLSAIRTAGIGVYPASIAGDVSVDYLARYFSKEKGYYRVSRELRQIVVFAPQNLLRDAPFSKLDLLVCRNMLIYIKPEFQRQILLNFAYALSPDGYLFLGNSESLGDAESYFSAVDGTHKLFQYHSSTRPNIVTTFTNRLRARGHVPEEGAGGPSKLLESRQFLDLNGLLQDVLGRFVPASIVVDQDLRVHYFFGETRPYLRMPRGRAELNLLNLVRPELKAPISTAVNKAFEKQDRVVYEKMAVKDGDALVAFDLIVEPNRSGRPNEWAVIVFNDFERSLIGPEDRVHTLEVDRYTLQHMQDLERRLEYTEETLQATIEELETSNEELQATNEELMAANEELQSTNEELQSTNEELTTVNAEYHEKIHDMMVLTNDMDNLLRSSEISTVFLDRQLRIRRYTRASQQVINLTDADVGRPLSHFSHTIADINLVKLARRVLQTWNPVDHEGRDLQGYWYLVRIYPYLVDEKTCDGVVITFVDITAIKDANRKLKDEIQERMHVEEALRISEERLQKLVAGKPAVVYCSKSTGEYANTFISPNVGRYFGYDPSDFLDNPRFWFEHIHPDDVQTVIQLRTNLNEEKSRPLEYRYLHKDGTYHWVRDEIKLILDEDGHPDEALGYWIDITDERGPSDAPAAQVSPRVFP